MNKHYKYIIAAVLFILCFGAFATVLFPQNNNSAAADPAAATEFTLIVKYDGKPVTVDCQSNIIQETTQELVQQTLNCFAEIDGHIINKEILPFLNMALVDFVGDLEKTIENLNNTPGVAFAETDEERALFYISKEPLYEYQWHLPQIKAEEAWEKTKGNQEMIVAILDTGVDYTHPDLTERMWSKNGLYGYDFFYDNPDPMDQNGHGTHIAGIVAATENELGVMGIAPNIKIMAVKVFPAHGATMTSVIIKGIDYILEQKNSGENIVAVNMSYGTSPLSADHKGNEAEKAAMQKLNDAGILMFIAAGNSNNNNNLHPVYPANYPLSRSIVVGASNNFDRRANFSNYGRTTVDIFAPGTDIYSTLPGNKYGFLSGTSMAAPITLGVAMLIWGQNPDWTPDQVRRAVIGSGDWRNGLLSVSHSRVNADRATFIPPPHDASIVLRHTNGSVRVWYLNKFFSLISSEPVYPYFNPRNWSLRAVADLNGDGNPDLLWQHDDGRMRVWYMDEFYRRLKQVNIQPDRINRNWVIRDVADMNGDRHPDLVFWNREDHRVRIWSMNGVQRVSDETISISRPANWRIRAVADINNDQKADIVWQHADGRIQTWLQDGINNISEVAFVPNRNDSRWLIIAVSDIDNDGNNDIVWRHTTGHTKVWYMDGLNKISTNQADTSKLHTNWRIRGVTDMNKDSYPDILWSHTDGRIHVWSMDDNFQLINVSPLDPEKHNTNWLIRGFADMNNDGNSDIVTQHTDGRFQVWSLDGITRTKINVTTPDRVGSDWVLAGIADMNRNGRQDFILWNKRNNQVRIWIMDGLNRMRNIAMTEIMPSQWRIRGVADMSGDGNQDIVWRHHDGRLRVWIMDRTRRTAIHSLTPLENMPRWNIWGISDLNNDGHNDIIWRHADHRIKVWYMNGLIKVSEKAIMPEMITSNFITVKSPLNMGLWVMPTSAS